MRRTLLSVLVAVVTFAVTSAVLVTGFSLVGGRSTGPTQGSSASAPEPSEAADPSSEPARSPDVPPARTRGLSTGPLGGVGIGFGPGSGTPEPTEPPAQSTPRTGLLTEDFRELGIDDPTTVVDESLRSACDVVGGTVAGPALCNDR